MEKLVRKYGFYTAVSMVVGIVIGSGVFKSAGNVLSAAGGDMKLALLAWGIGGLIMIASAYSFSLLTVRLDDVTGFVDYIEHVTNEKIAYVAQWFITIVYYPSLVSILSWLAGSVTANLIGVSNTVNSPVVWGLALGYFALTYTLSFVSPILAGKWQVSATVIKMIPLLLLALVGIVVGTINGNMVESITVISPNSPTGSLVKAVAITAFAYDGWILATSIGGEIKDPKKNLPKALVIGSLIIVGIYILFFLGLSGVVSNSEAIDLAGNLDVSVLAAKRLFGTFLGSSVSVLILISVLGTLNGVTMASMRGMITIANKEVGPAPKLFQKLSKSDVSVYGGLVAVVASLFFMFIWFGNFNGYFGGFMDTSILSIVFLYAFYIPVYVYVILNVKDVGFISRFVMPVIAILGSLYLIYGAFSSDKVMFGYYFILIIVILGIGILLYRNKKDV